MLILLLKEGSVIVTHCLTLPPFLPPLLEFLLFTSCIWRVRITYTDHLGSWMSQAKPPLHYSIKGHRVRSIANSLQFGCSWEPTADFATYLNTSVLSIRLKQIVRHHSFWTRLCVGAEADTWKCPQPLQKWREIDELPKWERRGGKTSFSIIL